MSIGGNKWALLQVKDKGAKNGIGAYEAKWTDCTSILGWLDLNTGDSKHTTFNTKVQESQRCRKAHIIFCVILRT